MTNNNTQNFDANRSAKAVLNVADILDATLRASVTRGVVRRVRHSFAHVVCRYQSAAWCLRTALAAALARLSGLGSSITTTSLVPMPISPAMFEQKQLKHRLQWQVGPAGYRQGSPGFGPRS